MKLLEDELGGGTKEGRTRLRSMCNVELKFNNMCVKNREREIRLYSQEYPGTHF
jgi:hypothetical protein